MSKLATFLGISQDQLKTELQAANATLATVAQAHGKTRDELKSFITSTAKTQLDQAVTNKKLTQQQADNALVHAGEQPRQHHRRARTRRDTVRGRMVPGGAGYAERVGDARRGDALPRRAGLRRRASRSRAPSFSD